MKIAINSGHCVGLDSGAVGEYSQEAVIVREVGQLVCSYLQAVGYETVFIQENELSDIVDISNSSNADLFVSIHCNSAENTSAKGTETFCYSGSQSGYRLAKCVQTQLVDTLDTIDRGIKTARFYVLVHTDAPAILTELGFISNLDEENMLNNRIDDMARAIARGITDYFA